MKLYAEVQDISAPFNNGATVEARFKFRYAFEDAEHDATVQIPVSRAAALDIRRGDLFEIEAHKMEPRHD